MIFPYRLFCYLVGEVLIVTYVNKINHVSRLKGQMQRA